MPQQTQIPRSYLGAVIVPPSGRVLPCVTADAWFALKERQTLADGSSARINWDRRDRLAALPSTLPGARPAPAPSVFDPAQEIEAGLTRARPAISAAVARRLRGSEGGAA